MSRTCILNIWNKWILLMVSYVQSLSANFISAYYRITTWPPQKKKKIRFFLLPVLVGQICFVLVLISPNHKARNWYPEMVMARTVYHWGLALTKRLFWYVPLTLGQMCLRQRMEKWINIIIIIIVVIIIINMIVSHTLEQIWNFTTPASPRVATCINYQAFLKALTV